MKSCLITAVALKHEIGGNDFMYWELMRRACLEVASLTWPKQTEYRSFDFKELGF
jgi:hypothetical protein